MQIDKDIDRWEQKTSTATLVIFFSNEHRTIMIFVYFLRNIFSHKPIVTETLVASVHPL